LTREFSLGIHDIAELTRTADEFPSAIRAPYLASDDSSFLTGVELFVDEGMAQI
jgi:hypothetical protein